MVGSVLPLLLFCLEVFLPVRFVCEMLCQLFALLNLFHDCLHCCWVTSSSTLQPQLLRELVNLLLQIGHHLILIHNVFGRLGLQLFAAQRKSKRRESIRCELHGWGNSGNQPGLGISSQRGRKKHGELGVAKITELVLNFSARWSAAPTAAVAFLGQLGQTMSQMEQRLVDRRQLLELLAHALRVRLLLPAGQIHQLRLSHAGGPVLVALLILKGKNCVGT
mmetsp:Transcript_44471/g.100417  ORF Transcript_44471/g.100417 Transcript_44471/m.100417 type:complete len:221 (-) Transcript_44471:869-1531(-)